MGIISSFIKGNIGSFVDGALGALGSAQQNYYNSKLAAQQNDYNIEMWNRQNEYNSPINTMQRLTDAGINPRAYNQIGQFANATQPQAHVGIQKVSEIAAFQSLNRQRLENKLLAQQLEQAKMDTEYKRSLSNKAFRDQSNNDFKTWLAGLKQGYDLMEFNPDMRYNFSESWSNGGYKAQPGYKQFLKFNADAQRKRAYDQWQERIAKWRAKSDKYNYEYLERYGVSPGASILGVPMLPYLKLGEKLMY